MLNKLFCIVMPAILCALSLPVSAQTPPDETKIFVTPSDVSPEAIIYRDKGFKGPAVNFSSANANPGVRWSVNSIRIRSGVWEICSGARFSGKCLIVEGDRPDLKGYYYGWTGKLGSIRPANSQPEAAKPSPAAGTFYECDRGTRLTVRFSNATASVRVNNGGWTTLRQVPSGSGFAYFGSKYQLRGKGDEALWVANGKPMEQCNVVPILR